jgi:ribose transport system permease protein
MTMGQAVVIIAGGLDLSSGTALSLLTCVLTTVMKKSDPLTGVYAWPRPSPCHGYRGDQRVGIGYLHFPVITFATSYLWSGIGPFLRVPGAKRWTGSGLLQRRPWWRGAGLAEGAGAVFPPALVLILIGCAPWLIVARTRTGATSTRSGATTRAPMSAASTSPRCRCGLPDQLGFIFLTALFSWGRISRGDARMGDP